MHMLSLSCWPPIPHRVCVAVYPQRVRVGSRLNFENFLSLISHLRDCIQPGQPQDMILIRLL